MTMNSIRTVALFLSTISTVFSCSAHAATIRIASTAYSRDIVNNGNAVVDSSTKLFDTASDGSSLANSATTSTPNAFADTAGSVDIVSGKLRSRTETNHLFGEGANVNEASGSTEALLLESFAVSGSGSITASLTYDGFWAVSYPSTPGFDAIGNLTLANARTGGLDWQQFFVSPDSGSIGSTAGTLTASLNVSDGDVVNLSTYLVTQIVAGTIGVVDFSNTAILSLISSPGITLKFSDPRFLSADASPSPVPLPGALPLYFGGLVVLGGLVRRKRSLTANS